ncbi:reverse transcriptase (RNA-dependent DNA polymerase) domain-containing protein [Phthorimaea operculella]|nr:reverse transcriptase (RNA-dependent DNA polymerase) domain-containing protein [Phthorimaea operculella]
MSDEYCPLAHSITLPRCGVSQRCDTAVAVRHSAFCRVTIPALFLRKCEPNFTYVTDLMTKVFKIIGNLPIELHTSKCREAKLNSTIDTCNDIEELMKKGKMDQAYNLIRQLDRKYKRKGTAILDEDGKLLIDSKDIVESRCIRISGRIPKDFQESRIVALPKKTNTMKCEEHRTLSLISQASKILIKIVQNRLKPISESYIGADQYGFREGKGTREVILALRLIVDRRLGLGLETHIAFIDLEKAFKVNWRNMMKVLKNIGVDYRDRKIIFELYKQQETAIHIGEEEGRAKIIITNDSRCTPDIKARIAMAKKAFNGKKTLLKARISSHARKKLIKGGQGKGARQRQLAVTPPTRAGRLVWKRIFFCVEQSPIGTGILYIYLSQKRPVAGFNTVQGGGEGRLKYSPPGAQEKNSVGLFWTFETSLVSFSVTVSITEDRAVKRAYLGKPNGKRPVGRPRYRWADEAEKDLLQLQHPDWRTTAQDRDSWRLLVSEAKILFGSLSHLSKQQLSCNGSYGVAVPSIDKILISRNFVGLLLAVGG